MLVSVRVWSTQLLCKASDMLYTLLRSGLKSLKHVLATLSVDLCTLLKSLWHMSVNVKSMVYVLALQKPQTWSSYILWLGMV